MIVALSILGGLSLILTGLFWPRVTGESFAERDHAEWVKKAAADRAADTDVWYASRHRRQVIYPELSPGALAAEHERLTVDERFPEWFAELVGAGSVDEWLELVRVKYGVRAAA